MRAWLLAVSLVLAGAPALADDKSSNWIRVQSLPTGGSMAGKGEQIEIQSFQWGSAASAAGGSVRPTFVTYWDQTKPDASASGVNQIGMDDTAGKEKLRRGSGSILSPDANYVREKMQPNASTDGGEWIADVERPSASGLPTGKRQHKPFVITKEVDKSSPRMMHALAQPLPQGSVRVKVKTPWLACRVGAAYPRLELAGGGRRYVLEDVRVASCGRSGGGSDEGPEESITFVYGKLG